MVEPTPVDPTPPAPVNNVPAIVRTVVPIVVGAVISWLITRGFDLSAYENSINAWLVVVVTSLYYALFKWLESKWPVFGWFLGLAKAQPVYVNPKTGDQLFTADQNVGPANPMGGGYTGGKPSGAPYTH